MQFSLRFFLFCCIGIAVTLGAIFGFPLRPLAATIIVLIGLIPPVVVAGLVYGRGNLRAFFVGMAASVLLPHLVSLYFAIIPLGALLISPLDSGEVGEEIWYFRVGAAAYLAYGLVSGLVGVGVRMFAQSSQAKQEREVYEVVATRVAGEQNSGAQALRDLNALTDRR